MTSTKDRLDRVSRVLRIVAKLDKLAGEPGPDGVYIQPITDKAVRPREQLRRLEEAMPYLGNAFRALQRSYNSKNTKDYFKKRGIDPGLLSNVSKHVTETEKALKYLDSRIESMSAVIDMANKAIGYKML